MKETTYCIERVALRAIGSLPPKFNQYCGKLVAPIRIIKRENLVVKPFGSNEKMMPSELYARLLYITFVSGGARSDWGVQLVAQMFSFLETVRLQGGEALPKALAPRARPIV